MAERAAGRRVRYLKTTAFSNKPESMKYRGIFRLEGRKENPPPSKTATESDDLDAGFYAKRYSINYVGLMGQWTLAEGLAKWKKKEREEVCKQRSSQPTRRGLGFSSSTLALCGMRRLRVWSLISRRTET